MQLGLTKEVVDKIQAEGISICTVGTQYDERENGPIPVATWSDVSESHWSHRLSAYFVFLCCPVETWRQADRPSKESKHILKRFIISEVNAELEHTRRAKPRS
jgi:hypothetical protein